MQSLVSLSKSVMSILWNIAQEEKCHKALVQNHIPEVVTPFCYDCSIQVRWESKSFLAVLHPSTGPSYYPFLRLSVEEINLLRLCFQNAAVSDDHTVILKLGNSMVRYSARELAIGIAGLTHHKTNRAAFADPKILASTFNLLISGSVEEKMISIVLMSKLVDEPGICSVLLSNHPDVLEVLQALSEDEETGEPLKQNSLWLLTSLLDRISGVVSTLQGNAQLKPSTVVADDPVFQNEKELKRLLTWATTEMKKSKVLCDASQNDTLEMVMSMIFLISHIREMLHFNESRLSVQSALQDCPGLLSALQDYTEKHFFSKFIHRIII